jgi:hypothetical protein
LKKEFIEKFSRMIKFGLILFILFTYTHSLDQQEKFKQLNILSRPVPRQLNPHRSNHYLVNKLIHNLFGSNDCNVGLFQSNNDILNRLHSISNCYNCRIAITSDGRVTTFKEYRLESKSYVYRVIFSFWEISLYY